MQYPSVVFARFGKRLHRFAAEVWLKERWETIHVKNTGRLQELLRPEAQVALVPADNPNRKTAYDLVAVYKEGLGWVNIDSLAPNKVVKDWLMQGDFDRIRPEYPIGTSRIDFWMEKEDQQYLLEVKGCTLEREGVGYFPDAPTQRGVKHLRELICCQQAGMQCIVAFVIQMEGVEQVRPNTATHPAFAETLQEAEACGVQIWHLPCRVAPDRLEIIAPPPTGTLCTPLH